MTEEVIKHNFIEFVKDGDIYVNQRKLFKEFMVNTYGSEEDFDADFKLHIQYIIEASLGVIPTFHNYQSGIIRHLPRIRLG
jgi:hypothetical protein